ncbi:DUF1489 domain-containing protein [Sphingomonas sp.]|uniref:DUF1489 family protein n=1 Tax=Sphingomonas sp. TaxID=28214 RepID=UPI0025FBB6D7|nr:DUF1489 domain-containing protein [Sphingomonas sp.]
MLHLTKVAFGCDSLEFLTARISARAEAGPVRLTTRYRPKRHEELVGGSLYWILKHTLVARSEILGFSDSEDGRIDILVASVVIPVRPMARRAHQGWRYLEADAAPPDWQPGDEEGDTMPAELAGRLAAMGLL